MVFFFDMQMNLRDTNVMIHNVFVKLNFIPLHLTIACVWNYSIPGGALEAINRRKFGQKFLLQSYKRIQLWDYDSPVN